MEYTSRNFAADTNTSHFEAKRRLKQYPHELRITPVGKRNMNVMYFTHEAFTNHVEPLLRAYKRKSANSGLIINAIKETLGITLFLPELGEPSERVFNKKRALLISAH